MIAITGATGFVGEAVVNQARADGLAVRAIVRDPAAASGFAHRHDVELFHGNVIHRPTLEGAFTGINCVVHLVGIINEWQENTFERAHVEATANVLDAAKRAGVKRFVHMSALGTRAHAVSRYHQTKWAAEESVRKSGLPATIFRPSLIYGPGDKSITVLARIVRRAPVVPVLGDGQAKIQPVRVENVARAFVGAIKTDEAVGKTYDLVGPEPFTWNELYDQLLRHYNLRKPKLHLPLGLLSAPAWLNAKLFQYPPFNREQLIMAREDNTGDPLPAEREFGLARESFAAGLQRYLA